MSSVENSSRIIPPSTEDAWKITEPLYYHRNYSNDIPADKKADRDSWVNTAQRVGMTALPFLSLYKPLSLPISLGMGAFRTYTCGSELFASIKSGNTSEIPYQLLQTAIAVIALAGTIFAHPAGMLITTGHDLIMDVVRLTQHLQKEEYQEAMESCFSIINNALYLSLFLRGGLELAIASLAMQILIGLYQSRAELMKGNYIEAAGHLGMSLVRGNQLAGQVKILQTKWGMEKFLNSAKNLGEQRNQEELNDQSIDSALPTLLDGTLSNEIDEKQALVNRTISNLNDAIQNHVIVGQEDKRLVEIARKLSSKLTEFIPYLKSAPVPGCCLYSGENYLMNVVNIAEKQERVEDAIKQIKITTGVDKKVSEYFQKTLTKLQHGTNVPLPDFFHATRTGLENIIQTKTIRQSTFGAAGPGTYMSCNNEGHIGYGPYAFAIDEGILANTQGKFFTGRQPNGDVYFSLWAAVLKDIPILESTIAYIDTASDDVERVRALVKAQNLNIEVMDRSTSDAIRRIFDLSTQRRETPSFGWSKQRSDDYLPKNMYLRSELGTFRRFKPGIPS